MFLYEQHTHWLKKSITKYRTRKSAKTFFFFLASFFFRWASSKLRDSFTMVFTQNSRMLHSPAHHFFTTLKSDKVVWTSYWRTMASLATLFSKINPCAQITEQQNNDCWIRNMVVCEDRESLWHPLLTQCLKSLVNDSSANTAYIYSRNQWWQTCCSAIDGKLQPKHAPGDKKVT